MIISRTPLRISLGGGGTDLPSFYKKESGFVISASIDKYIYISLNQNFTSDYFIRYSLNERVKNRNRIKHDIFRETLKRFKINEGIEITSLADIQSGTGLGSSGAFTVGLINALMRFKKRNPKKNKIASEACKIEIDILKRKVGKQDQFSTAIGGITYQKYNSNGTVIINKPMLSKTKMLDFSDKLLLFYTGETRNASKVLSLQNVKKSSDVMKNLIETKNIGKVVKIIDEADFESYGQLLNKHWNIKRERAKGITNKKIDEIYELGINNGAVGGKLVGARLVWFFFILYE